MTTVDKNIPIPPIKRRNGGKGKPLGDYGKALLAAAVGDSFLVPTRHQYTNLRKLAQRKGLVITVRREGEGWRIWRTG